MAELTRRRGWGRGLGAVRYVLVLAALLLAAGVPAQPTVAQGTEIKLGELAKAELNPGETASFTIALSRNKQVIIGAANLDNISNFRPTLRVSGSICPSSRLEPSNGQSRGVVYCTPNENGTVTVILSAAEATTRLSYAVFAERLASSTSIGGSLWDTTTSLSARSIHLYRFTEAEGRPDVTMTLHYAGNDPNAAAYMYNEYGGTLCDAFENPDPNPSPSVPHCDSYSDNRVENDNYIVVLNGGNNCIRYRGRWYRGTPPSVGSLSNC